MKLYPSVVNVYQQLGGLLGRLPRRHCAPINRAANLEGPLLCLKRPVSGVADVFNADFEVDFVDLFFKYSDWITVTVAAGGAPIYVPYKGLAHEQIEILSAELIDKRMS